MLITDIQEFPESLWDEKAVRCSPGGSCFAIYSIDSNEMWIDERTYYRYSLLGLTVGELLLVEFNEAAKGYSPFIRVPLFTNRTTQDGRSIAYLLSTNDFRVKDGLTLYAIAGNLEGDQLRIVKYSNSTPIEILDDMTVDDGYSVINVDIFPVNRLGQSELAGIYAVALQRSNTDPSALRLKFQRVSESDVTKRNIITWDIYSETTAFLPGDIPVYFFARTHYGSFYSSSIFVNETIDAMRNLIVLYSGKEVKVLDFDPAVKSLGETIRFRQKDADGTSTVLGTESFFFAGPKYSITTVDIVVNMMKRFNPLLSTCTQLVDSTLSAVIHVAVGLVDTSVQGYKNNFLVHRELPEFRNIDFTYPASTTPLNPAARPYPFTCRNGYFNADAGHCDTMPSITQYLNDAGEHGVRTIDHRFFYPPSFSDPQEVDEFCSAVSGGDTFKYDACKTALARSKSCDLELVRLADQLGFPFSMYTNVFLTTHDRIVTVFAMNQQPQLSATLTVEYLNTIELLGTVIDAHIAKSGMHAFYALARHYWEIESIQRYSDICAALKNDSSDPFLYPYAPLCSKFAAASFDLNYFGMFMSSCIPGTMYCPSLSKTVVTRRIDDGVHTQRVHVKRPCPVDSFCISGSKISCPAGFMCPYEGMSQPIKCPFSFGSSHNMTCVQGKLEACPQGMVCEAMYYPPIGAPPGYFIARQENGEGILAPCMPGEWCSFARESTLANRSTLLCPAMTHCKTTKVLEPTACHCDAHNCSFCPSGTMIERACPAGSFCPDPSKNRTCAPTEWCPPGSIISQTCPSGWYCPTPAIKYICPAGSYCKSGSVRPLSCITPALCEEGSEKDDAVLGIVVIVIVFIGAASISAVYAAIRALFNRLMTQYAMQSSEERSHRAVKRMRHNPLFGSVSDSGDMKKLLDEARPPVFPAATPPSLSPSASRSDVLDVNGTSFKTPLIEADGLRITRSLTGNYEDGEDILVTKQPFMDIAFQNLGLKLHSGKYVLKNVSGELLAGELCAVLGPSGAGKSSFVTTISDRATYGHRVGDVYINGKSDSLSRYNKLIGFVPQEDIMMTDMTVEENIAFAARTKCSWNMSPAKVTQKVDTIIEYLGLSDIRQSLIGNAEKRGISGGQRKRVNIALELVNDPRVLFLDEPTSGLDSTSSMEVVKILRDIAARYRITVCCVIHQPRMEIAMMFHKLLLLGKGGRVVYHGPTELCLQYFEKIGFSLPPMVNPLDFYMDIIAGDVSREGDDEFVPSDLFDIWERHQEAAGVHRTVQSTDNRKQGFFSRYVPVTSSASDSINSDSTPGGKSQYARKSSVIAAQAPLTSRTARLPSEEKGATPLDYIPVPIVGGVIQFDEIRTRNYGRFKLSDELKKRRTLFPTQLFYCIKRPIIQQFRNIFSLITELTLTFVAGLFLSLIFQNREFAGPLPPHIIALCPSALRALCSQPQDDPIAAMSFLACLAISLSGVMSSLGAFGAEKVVHAREARGGLRSLAYYIGKNLVNLCLNIVIGPVVFLAIYVTMYQPRANIFALYGVLVAIYFTSWGYGYLLSLVMHQSNARLAGVVTTLVLSMFSGLVPTLPSMQKMSFPVNILYHLSFLRYGLEALYLLEIEEYKEMYDISTEMDIMGFDVDRMPMLMCVLVIAFGLGFRVLGFIVLKALKENSYVSRFVRTIRAIWSAWSGHLVSLPKRYI